MKQRRLLRHSGQSLCLVLLALLFYSCGGSEKLPGMNTGTGGTTDTGTGGTSSAWSFAYGGTGDEEMEAVVAASDGGLIVVGSSDSYSTADTSDALIVKVASDGQVAWAKTYGGSEDDMAIDIKPTSDGGYIVAGWTKSVGAGSYDLWVFKIDSSGAVQWEKSYGGAGMDQAWSVDATRDGGYVVAGGTTSFGAGGSDYWVLKLNASGDILWQKTYGGAGDDAPGGNFEEFVARVLEDKDGNFVVASESNSFGRDSDIWVIKLNPTDGSILWQYAYGDTDSDSMWTFQEASDGSYIVPGVMTFPGTSEADLWVFSLTTDGSIKWQKTFGVTSLWDEALTVGATSDGGAIVGGYYEKSSTDWYTSLIRIDANGTAQWQRQYKNGTLDWPNAVQELTDGSFIMAGVTTTGSNGQDLWLTKTDANGKIGTSCNLVSDLNLTIKETNTSPVATSVTGQDTHVTPSNTSAVVKDISPSPSSLCRAKNRLMGFF